MLLKFPYTLPFIGSVATRSPFRDQGRCPDCWRSGRLGLGVDSKSDTEMFLCSDPDGTAVLFVEGA